MTPEIPAFETDHNEQAVYDRTLEILRHQLLKREGEWKTNQELQFLEISGYEQIIDDLHIVDEKPDEIIIFMSFLVLSTYNCCKIKIHEPERIRELRELNNSITTNPL
jgi:hypothetical protein